MAVVVFDFGEWIDTYPELRPVNPTQAQSFFNLATLRLSNTDSSVVQDVDRRKSLLYILTAHIAAMFNGVNGQGVSGLVGRVTSASEGSVSASVDAGSGTNAQAWYMQTQYGALFWELTANLRTMRYIPGPPATGYNPYAGPYGNWLIR